MRVAVVLMALGTFGLTGCGSADPNAPAPGQEAGLSKKEAKREYEDALRQIVGEELLEMGELRDVSADAPLPEQARRMRVLARFMRGIGDRLERLDSPSDAQLPQMHYAEGMREMAEFIDRRIVPAMRRNDKQAVERSMKRLQSGRMVAVRKVRVAREMYADSGYRLPGEAFPGQGAPR